jgi:hypothetical protein
MELKYFAVKEKVQKKRVSIEHINYYNTHDSRSINKMATTKNT